MTRRWRVRSVDRLAGRQMPPKGADEASPRSGVRPPVPAAGAISRPGASASFVSDGPISSNSGRNGGKNAGRNCVSALPQRAIPGRDLLRILADIAFHHRCRSKGLRVRSPARRLTRPLAPATAGVFRSYRHPQSLPLKRRTPQSLPPGGFAVLNDRPVACQTREPTAPQGDRCPHIPAASAATYPLRCSAPQWARFDNRQRLQRTRSYPRTASAAAAQAVQAIPEPTTMSPTAPIPRDQHRQFCMTHSAPRDP